MDDLAAIAAYLKDLIERTVADYEQRAGRMTPAYLAQVERLAKLTPDPLWADLYRRTLRPDSITPRLNEIRRRLKDGQIIGAHGLLESFRMNVEFAERHLNHPIFQTGAKQRQYLDSARAKTNAERKRKADRKHREWVAAAQNAWKHNSRLTVSACADNVVTKLKLKPKQKKTVADVIRNFRPKKVGDAG
jgi:hypothetical protein